MGLSNKRLPGEILALPDFEVGEDIQSRGLIQEATWLIGFWINRGSATPKRRLTRWSATDNGQLIWGQKARERIASQVDQIRTWKVLCRSYLEIGNREATWFIDPPYTDRGRYYRINHVDYKTLSAYAHSRTGLVIVCENAGATWMPFSPLATIKSTKGKSIEVAWMNNEN